MNKDLPEPFWQLTPRPAPDELRMRVLDAVAHELARRTRSRWELVLECTVAASFVLGVGLNVWQQQADEAWQVRVYGPRPVSQSIVEASQAVTSVTDVETGHWIQQRLSNSRAGRYHAGPPWSERYERLLNGLTDLRSDVPL